MIDGKRKRRGSKTRHRRKRRTSALRRDALPNLPLPHHRQPTINDEKMAAHLDAPKLADALEHHGAELQKSRLKLDEIVHLLNSGTDPASIMNIIESTIQECRVIFAVGRKTLGDFREVPATDEEAPGSER